MFKVSRKNWIKWTKFTLNNFSPYLSFSITECNKSFILQYFSMIFNENIEKANFRKELMLADITPVWEDWYNKENCRAFYQYCQNFLIDVLNNQIYKNVNSILSKYQTGYQKGYRSQYSLIAMFERRRKHLDKYGNVHYLLSIQSIL